MENNADNTLSFSRLPQKLPLKKLGKQYQKLEGYVSIDKLTRVNELLVDSSCEMAVSLSFTRTNNKLFIHGEIEQEVTVACQRCLEPMQHKISTDMYVAVITQNKDGCKDTQKYTSGIDNKYEFVIADELELLDIYQLIEDEIILALPIVIKHDKNHGLCQNLDSLIL